MTDNSDVIKNSNILSPLSNTMAKLSPYQNYGVKWMKGNLEEQFGCILADDMGLGKTSQVIGLLAHYEETKIITAEQKALIIVPKSLVQNWLIEFSKFAPHINVKEFKKNCDISDATILVTTYGTVFFNLPLFQSYKFFIIILDEAHKIKNYKSKIGKEISKLESDKALLITGTPIVNHLEEIAHLVYVANKYGRGSGTITSLNLRRTKQETILDLPPLYYKDVMCKLSKKQQEQYKEIIFPLNSSYRDVFAQHGKQALGKLHQLKKIGNCPELSENEKLLVTHSGKFIKLFKILKSLEKEDKIIIFTFALRTIQQCKQIITQKLKLQVLYLQGKHSTEERMDIIQEFQNDPNKKVLIISIKAGGEGLNITKANKVIIFDLGWNNAIEEQAIARAFRRGQKRPVTVYRLINENSIEPSINELIQTKKEFCDDVMSYFTIPPTFK